MGTVLAAEVVSSTPKLGEGEGALPQKILRFSGDPSVGLEGRGVGAGEADSDAAARERGE